MIPNGLIMEKKIQLPPVSTSKAVSQKPVTASEVTAELVQTALRVSPSRLLKPAANLWTDYILLPSPTNS